MPIAGLQFAVESPAPADTGGMADDLDFALPPELEAAFARFSATHPDDPVVTRPDRSAHAPHGVGNFENHYGVPVFEGNPLPGLIVGMDVIYTRRADGEYERVMVRGEEIVLTILPMTRKGTLAEDPVPVAMRLIDESRTRVYQIDEICVYADFKLIQEQLSMNALQRVDGTLTRPRATQLLVRIRQGLDERAVAREIDQLWSEFCLRVFYDLPPEQTRRLSDDERRELWRGAYSDGLARIDADDARLMCQVGVETWEDRQRDFIDAVEKEKVLVTILFLIISVVAVVLIGVIFHMIVLQKTRDIGIIKSLGATRLGVASIFLAYGAAVGVVGGVLGVVSGSIFVYYINDIQDLLAQLNPNLRVWSPEVYTFDRIPNEVKPLAALAVFVAAVATSMLGAAWPAIKAARVWPVQALRYE
jgi:lipoprotein-releasing system permease protein